MAVKFSQKDLDTMIQGAIDWQPPDMTMPVQDPDAALQKVLSAATTAKPPQVMK